MLALLTSIYALAFVDRQIFNILAEPIKAGLHLSDWQIGVLAGPAFVVFYSIAGVPLGRIAERWNRVWLLSAVVVIWSGFTALSGLASGFLPMLLARIGVGANEAGCVPAAHSLIAEITPRERRARALATFSMGLPLGSLIGLSAGGAIAHYFDWRVAFLVVATPGVALAIVLLLAVRDPRGRNWTGIHPLERADDAAVPSLGSAIRGLWSKPSFSWITAGAAILALVGYGHSAFLASFFLRNHGAELVGLAKATRTDGALTFLGLAMGLGVGLMGAIGTALGGVLSDRFAARDFRNHLIAPVAATAVAAPLTAATLTVPHADLALSLLAVSSLLKSVWYGPVFAVLQGVASPRSRATTVSVFLLVMNGVGMGLGPPLIGGLSDAFARHLAHPEALRVSMLATTALILVAASCFEIGRRRLPHTAPS